MTAIEIVPAGNQRYQVEIEDDEGRSRHEVDVPDDLRDRLDTEGIAMQDVVRAAVEFLIDQEGRQRLDRQIDLGDVAARYEGFVEVVPEQAHRRATDAEPPTGQRVTERDDRSSDERLVDEVRQEQAEGRRRRQERRL
jgi:hypothetical protein